MTNPRKNVPGAYLALSVGVFCIASSAILVKVAALPGATSAFYRVLFAAAAAVPLYLSRPRASFSGDAVLLAVLGGLFFAVELMLWQVAVRVTSAANATLLVNIAPVWVGIGAFLVFRESLGAYFWLGLVVALAGMGLVVIGSLRHFVSFNSGDSLAVIASVFYALYLLVTQRVRSSMDTVTFLALSTMSSVSILLVTCLALGAPLTGFPMRSWIALAALGLLSHFGGYLAINYAAGELRATSISVTLLAQPVVTALLAIPLLSEFLTPKQVTGGVLVLAGIYLVNRRSWKRVARDHASA